MGILRHRSRRFRCFLSCRDKPGGGLLLGAALVAIVMLRRRRYKQKEMPSAASRISSNSAYGNLELQTVTPHETPRSAWNKPQTISPEPDDQKKLISTNSSNSNSPYDNQKRSNSLSDTRSEF